MYHFAALLVAVLSGSVHVLAQTTTTLSYDPIYDNSNLSLNNVACSDGLNGLENKDPKYTTLGSLRNFPNLGGAFTVSGHGSLECGTCYAVTYGSNMVNILAVDKSTTGFTVSKEAMNTLTGGLAEQLGRVDVTFVKVEPSECQL